ncbi:MAG: hypothetical protein JNJ73_09130 [Hyphomonadaceae bacterium]|nr:hypothetical protein [Hyphomonadaceae bacterium]
MIGEEIRDEVAEKVERGSAGPRTAVYVIHNHDDARLAYLLPALERLRAQVPLLQATSLVGYQASFAGPQSEWKFRLAQALAWRWEERCQRRFFERTRPFMERARKLAADIHSVWKAFRRPLTAYDERFHYIHMALTDKHLRVLAAFMESDCELAVVCEDDVIVKEESADRLETIIALSAKVDPSSYIYVDLGGGFSIKTLSVDNLRAPPQQGDPDFLHRFRKKVPNTTCCFLINRAYAARMYQTVTRFPELKRLAVGRTFITAAYMMGDNETRAGLYALTEPTVVQHGSATGDYQTSINPVVFK